MKEKRGRLAAGFSKAFWGGEAAGFFPVWGKVWSPAGTGALAQPLQRGAACMARLAWGQPRWHVPIRKRVLPASKSILGMLCVGLAALAKRCSCGRGPHRPRWGSRSAGNCSLWSQSACKYTKPGLKMSCWSVEGRSLKSHLRHEAKHLGLFPLEYSSARINGS